MYRWPNSNSHHSSRYEINVKGGEHVHSYRSITPWGVNEVAMGAFQISIRIRWRPPPHELTAPLHFCSSSCVLHVSSLSTALDTHPLQQATRICACAVSNFSIANTLLKPLLINDHLWFSATSQFGIRIHEAEEQHKLAGRETYFGFSLSLISGYHRV
jgi:hypothetical protein